MSRGWSPLDLTGLFVQKFISELYWVRITESREAPLLP
ncbi:hypothetical protein LEP1GSC047_3416 [Leptospira inadai serovar Lyme str. 10]|uniref:Uncharacterized protein n=1 Tax=Leptospira inadai serovar Lyme str. 10 TaxID=1049790 RepID=V6HAI3_9LEPT|nr:hypothetical protein LEP1GSC047_3416 [Leptospira inadai serovar Lyme str. 10]